MGPEELVVAMKWCVQFYHLKETPITELQINKARELARDILEDTSEPDGRY